MSLDANTGVAAKTGGFSLSAMLRSPLALPLAGLIVVSILMGLASDNFFSLNNIMNVLRQVSVVGILAVGMTFVILTGGIDLSVGSIIAFSSVAGVMLSNAGWNPLVVIVVMLAMALATARYFRSLYPIAGWLLLPYLLWLCLATALNYETGKLNPGADAAPLGITGVK